MNRITKEQEGLWNRIQDFELDDIDASYTFSDRLALENGWSLEYALRVIDEYKKYIFLICIANEPLTPSDQVDQAWHLHLIYTRSYWDEFCGQVLNRNIHHGPTKGGQTESTKFYDWYSSTKKWYLDVFEKAPPLDIWPDTKKRFKDALFQRVNLHKNWIIKKPFQ